MLGVELGGSLKERDCSGSRNSRRTWLWRQHEGSTDHQRDCRDCTSWSKDGSAAWRLSADCTGIGDLIVTCASVHSRNRKAGYLIGQGYTMQQAMDEVKMVVEGVYSAKAAKSLAEKYGVEMPIIMEVNEVLFENKPAADAVRDLMLRDKKVETPMLPW